MPSAVRATVRGARGRWLGLASAAALVVGIVPLLEAAPAAAAGTIAVTTTADETGSGSACSLRDAIASANTNADVGGCVGAGSGGPFTILVPAGTYALSLGELDVGTGSGASITIEGASAASTVIEQTTSTARVFNLDPNTAGDVAVAIDDVTISGGYAQGYGGGAILGGWTGDSLTLDDDVITHNSCSGSYSAAGLSWSPAGDVTIDATTFSDNDCGQAAGAVLYTANGTLSISDSTFTDNEAGASGSAGGALFLGNEGGTASFDIDDSTFAGNEATSPSGIGGAIYLGSGTLTLGTSRLAGNTAPFGGAVGVRGGSAGAVDDWWGCPTGPDTAGCDTTSTSGGTLTDHPWITLSNTASPATIQSGGATTLTASVLQDSDGNVLTAGDVSVMAGVPVTWGNAVDGTLSHEQTTLQSSGTATATLTQDGTCNPTSATATVDNGPVTATAAVQCLPDLTATKVDSVSGAAVTGQQWTYTITVANDGGSAATFGDGQPVLLDNLASGLTYGSPVASTSGVACSLSGDDLRCAADGTLTITPSGSFTVQLTASGPAGEYVNPRPGGVCTVDPDGLITESNDTNQSCSDTVDVTADDTTTTITSSIPNPSVVGQSVAVDYSVTPDAPGAGTPTGTVTVSDGTDSCSASVAAGQCTLTFSHAGTPSVTASYDGDANYNASVSTPATIQNVNKDDTKTTISGTAPSAPTVGQSVEIAYGVVADAPGAGTPSGEVTVSDGTLQCTGTVATGECPISFTTAGTHVLTATYVGDGDFNGSVSGSFDQHVSEAQTTTTITSDLPNPTKSGVEVTVDYAVTVDAPGAGTPTGDVMVTDGVDRCTGTVAAGSCTLALRTFGTRTLVATYEGDGNFAGSTSAGVTHTVHPPQVTIGDFAYESAALTPQLKDKIVALAHTLKADRASEVLLTGYCNPGETCHVLSQQRARVVAGYLVAKLAELHLGVTVTMRGGGSTKLVAKPGSSLNRRVMALFDGNAR